MAGRNADRPAIRECTGGRTRTFADLRAEAEALPPGPPVAVCRGRGTRFVLDLLRAWRDDAVFVPLDDPRDDPTLSTLPDSVVQVKTTSGSSGQPRRVLLTADQLAADAAQIVSTMGLRADLPNVAMISMAHSYGFSNLALPLVLHGIPLIAADDPLPATLSGVLESSTAVTVPAVPALWRAWLQAGVVDSRIRLAISAGAPLPADLEAQAFASAGVKIHNFYGSSECGGIAYDRTDVPRPDPACAGTPMDGVSLTVDSQTRCLRIRSAAVASGYLEPDDSLGGGEFRSGDVADIRQDGSVILTGRVGDTINVAGRKIPPARVEARLQQVPGVRHCVVFGVPSADPARVEDIVACVNLADGTPLEAARRSAARALPPGEYPRHWHATPELAPDDRGKISRAAWRSRWIREFRAGGAPRDGGQ